MNRCNRVWWEVGISGAVIGTKTQPLLGRLGWAQERLVGQGTKRPAAHPNRCVGKKALSFMQVVTADVEAFE